MFNYQNIITLKKLFIFEHLFVRKTKHSFLFIGKQCYVYVCQQINYHFTSFSNET